MARLRHPHQVRCRTLLLPGQQALKGAGIAAFVGGIGQAKLILVA